MVSIGSREWTMSWFGFSGVQSLPTEFSLQQNILSLPTLPPPFPKVHCREPDTERTTISQFVHYSHVVSLILLGQSHGLLPPASLRPLPPPVLFLLCATCHELRHTNMHCHDSC